MKLMRACMLTVLSVAVGLALIPGAAAEAPAVTTHAEAAALIDVASGRLLYSHNGDEPMRIASLTKIMTAIVAIESGTLSDIVTVGPNAFGVEGSSIYLRLDEEMSLQHLLYGLMLRSGNDAAVAIAEHVGGSVEGFALMMNEKAAAIGMTNSYFVNPHGLDADGHLSTANDMALLTAYALNNAAFRDIVKTPSINVPNPHEKWDYRWRNKNKMLHLYEGADGVKTGYTKTAGRCLVSSATRGAQQLVAVTLSDGDDWADHAKLLNYGFKHYPARLMYEGGKALEGTRLASPYTFAYPLTEQERSAVRVEVEMTAAHTVAGKLGQKAVAQYSLDGHIIGQLPFYELGHELLKNSGPLKYRQTAALEDEGMRGNVAAVLKRLIAALFGA